MRMWEKPWPLSECAGNSGSVTVAVAMQVWVLQVIYTLIMAPDFDFKNILKGMPQPMAMSCISPVSQS